MSAEHGYPILIDPGHIAGASGQNKRPGLLDYWRGRALRAFGGSSGHDHISLDAPSGWAYVTSKDGTHLATNAYYDGANWQRYDTALPAALLFPSALGSGVFFYTAPAGANPITWIGGAALGGVLTSWIGADTAIPALTSVYLASLNLTPGTWRIQGQLVVTANGGAGTIDAAIAQAGTGTQVGGGTSVTIPTATYWATLQPHAIVTIAANTSYHVKTYSNVACTARWIAPFLPNGTETGLVAWRLQ